MAKGRSLFRILARGLFAVGLIAFCLFVVLIIYDSFSPPISTLMIGRTLEGKRYERHFVRLSDVSSELLAAVIASEDATFCRNDGVDWGALHEVLSRAGKNGPSRGASTITMQTAKNLFLWPGRSTIRKGLEIGVALFLGKVWSKSRTIETYLNIAEWGDGLYGVEAASQRYFHKRAADLDARQAALLATALPNPIKRDPAHPNAFQRRLAASLLIRAHDGDILLDCLTR
jgi:monofunctional glycosyltransferase